MKHIIFTLLAVVVFTATANVVGGDISLLTQYEQHGAKYYDKNGQRIRKEDAADYDKYIQRAGGLSHGE